MSAEQLIADARIYTADLTKTASKSIDDAVNSVSAVGYSLPNFQKATLPTAPATSTGLIVPTLAPITLDDAGIIPAAPTFQDIPTLEAGIAPVLSVSTPTLNMPSVPNGTAEFVFSPPTIADITFPEPPSALTDPIFDAPVLSVNAAPVSPQVSLPAFTALAPTDLPATPTDYVAQFSSAYSGIAPSAISMLDGYVDSMLAKRNPRFAEQMAAIETQLATYMAGGTGLDPTAENAIYERSRSKNDAEARRVRDALYAEAASNGFTLPSGAMSSALAQARQAGADNNAKASTEIAVMQAEMEQKNLQFAVTTSTGLRTAVLSATIGYHQNLITINGQAIDYAKTVLSAIIEVYNTAIKAFGIKVEGFRAQALVYETQLKGAMAGIDLYRAQISALEALTNVDKTKVEVYRARIESLMSLASVYRARVEAVMGRVSLERTKLEVFQSRVQAYGAYVQGKSSEWQGYSAAISGESAKVRLYGEQISAFSAQVESYKSTIQAKTEVIRSISLSDEARARNYSALVSGYSAKVQAVGDIARTKIAGEQLQLAGFEAQVRLAVANAELYSNYYKNTTYAAIENANGNLKAQIAGVESQRAFGDVIARLGTANAGIFGNLASAGLSGMNTLAADVLTG